MSTIKTETLSTPSNATVPVDTVVNGTAKAWVNFDGTGTVAIRRAFNVSSVTDNSSGDFTVNFTNAMVDANFSVVAMPGSGSAVNNYSVAERSDVRTSSSVRIHVWNGATLYDLAYNSVAIFS